MNKFAVIFVLRIKSHDFTIHDLIQIKEIEVSTKNRNLDQIIQNGSKMIEKIQNCQKNLI